VYAKHIKMLSSLKVEGKTEPLTFFNQQKALILGDFWYAKLGPTVGLCFEITISLFLV